MGSPAKVVVKIVPSQRPFGGLSLYVQHYQGNIGNRNAEEGRVDNVCIDFFKSKSEEHP